MQKKSAEPKISINKLSEYLIATAARRKRILMDQKYPRGYITHVYRDAYRAVVEFVCRGHDPQILEKHRSRLRLVARGSDHDAQNANLCLDAIAAFEGFDSGLPIGQSAAKRAELRFPKLLRSGVRISVKPDILLAGQDNRGRPYVGAIKLCFSKTRKVEDAEAAYTGAVLHHYMQRYASDQQELPCELCIVVDVFARRAYPAPRAHKQRLSDVRAACEEIAARWPGL
ncbi:MAG TPA: hypothetical protein VF613_13615 [Longimicrobium sp.]